MRTYFDHEKLAVYQQELCFITWGTALLLKIKRSTDARIAEVSDQLERASLSALLNTAEGNGRRQSRTHAKFLDDARGSATECATCLDALVAKGVCSGGEIDEGRQLLLRIASMLTKLIERFDISSSSSSPSSIIREEPHQEEFDVEEEDENENEDEH